VRLRDGAVKAHPSAVALAHGELLPASWLHAHAVRPASTTGLPSRSDAPLLLAERPLPSGIARALAVDARAVLAAAARTPLVLAPRPPPPRVALARAEGSIAHAMAIAAVHASARGAARRRRIRCDGAIPIRLALAHAVEAPAAPRARRLPALPGGTCPVLALGAAPPGITRARATHLIAHAVVVAAARAHDQPLARRARIMRLALTHARSACATHAMPIAVAGARGVRAVGARPTRLAHAQPTKRVARAMCTAALRAVRPSAHLRAASRALGLLTRWPTPPCIAHARAVGRARSTLVAVVGAAPLGALGAVPAVVAHALAGTCIWRLDAGAVVGAVGGARGMLARAADKGLLAHARGQTVVSIDSAPPARAAARGARACWTITRGSTPPIAARAPTAPTADAVRLPAALVGRGVRRAAAQRAVAPLPASMALAPAIGKARAMAGASTRARGQLALRARPPIVTLADCVRGGVEGGEAPRRRAQVGRVGMGHSGDWSRASALG